MLRGNRLLPRFKSSALKYLSIQSSQLTIQHSSPLSPKSGYPLLRPNHLLLLPPPTRSFSSKPPSDKNTSDPSPTSANTKWGLSTSNIPLDDRLQATLNSVLSTKHSTRTTSTVRLALLGNLIITGSKFAAYSVSGSSAMLSESIHSLVDSGNQALLLIGLRDVGRLNDASHPYGYGKSIYFWSLVSALGTFWLGAGVSMTHSVQYLMNPGLEEVTWHVWGVLGVSLVVDGWVLRKVVGQVMEDKPRGVGYFKHIMAIRDPATLAILLEDGAACTGVLIAGLGISLSHLTSNPIFDGLAGVGVSCLLAGMGFTLARLNQRFLLGQAVDSDIVQSINAIILERDSIDSVASVQSQWTGPYSFSYKAEIDVDGTFLAAKLMDRYQKEFLAALEKDRLEQDLKFLLSLYAEDVMRTVESEIKDIEREIRETHPEAAYIELEPDSRTSAVFAIDQATKDVLKVRAREIKQLARMMKTLKEEKEEKEQNENDNKDDTTFTNK